MSASVLPPLSTQDDVAAYLLVLGVHPGFCDKGRGQANLLPPYQSSSRAFFQITMDGGADLVGILHSERRDLLANVIGGTEETTTGYIRLRSMAEKGMLHTPLSP